MWGPYAAIAMVERPTATAFFAAAISTRSCQTSDVGATTS